MFFQDYSRLLHDNSRIIPGYSFWADNRNNPGRFQDNLVPGFAAGITAELSWNKSKLSFHFDSIWICRQLGIKRNLNNNTPNFSLL